MKCVDDDFNEVPAGTPGELAVRGPQVMAGYWRRPDETAKVMRGDWILTGDIATMDEDGYFSIVDRRKDMILVSGFNVFPNEVEAALVKMPGVKEARWSACQTARLAKRPRPSSYAATRPYGRGSAGLLQAASHGLQGAEIRRIP